MSKSVAVFGPFLWAEINIYRYTFTKNGCYHLSTVNTVNPSYIFKRPLRNTLLRTSCLGGCGDRGFGLDQTCIMEDDLCSLLLSTGFSTIKLNNPLQLVYKKKTFTPFVDRQVQMNKNHCLDDIYN